MPKPRAVLTLAADPSPEPLASSPPSQLVGARRLLLGAQRHLQVLAGAADRCAEASRRVEALIGSEASACERLAAIEAEGAAAIANWAGQTGGTGAPQLPDETRYADARRALDVARQIADAARLALPGITEQHRTAAAELGAAQAAVIAAARAVLIEDGEGIIAELDMLLGQVTERRRKLAGLHQLLRRQATASGSQEGYAASEALGKLEPREQAPDRQAILTAASAWEALADALCHDPAAGMEAA